MANQLAGETSPYLLQHADNPVDWQPWCPAALRRARDEDRPILLSIGYSACHWCHVMAHESFADPTTAAVMNRLFVNIKVDREERPDLDQIYQLAHQLLTRRAGGWPLTMFLTPDGKPFYGGTYFPKESRYGLPGFADLIERVAEVYSTQRADVEAQGQSLVDGLAQVDARPPPVDRLDEAPIDAAVAHLSEQFDRRHGGFGDAPKFPRETDLAFLLRRYFRTRDATLLEMVMTTLRAMAEGGLYDQIGGGFCRYSVDAEWNIPHFEKMLYDNALLLGVYADAWRLTREPWLARVVEDTAAWLMREMQQPEGGYASALDADSEGEEGRFYVWSRAEVEALLSPEEWAVAAAHWGLAGSPNFEGHAWHLRIVQRLDAVAGRLGISLEDAGQGLESARAKLVAARAQRVRPGCDDKVLTSWNALAIAGLVHAAQTFGRSEWLASARRALAFVQRTMWRDGRLLATWRAGQARLDAYLDDHAFLLAALIEALQADFRREDLDFAVEVADAMRTGFKDADGGFLFTRHDHETLVHRPRPVHDNPMPAGAAVAALSLLRLARLTGDSAYADAAERALRVHLAALGDWPSGAASLLIALDEALAEAGLAVVGGPAAELAPWREALAGCFAPDCLVVCLADSPGDLPPPLAAALAPEGRGARALLCRGKRCLPPLATPESLIDALEADGSR